MRKFTIITGTIKPTLLHVSVRFTRISRGDMILYVSICYCILYKTTNLIIKRHNYIVIKSHIKSNEIQIKFKIQFFSRNMPITDIYGLFRVELF